MTETTAASDTPLLHLSDPATRQDLEAWGPLTEATGPEMQTRGLTLWAGPAAPAGGPDEGCECGLWECAPGPSRWTLQTNELVTILSGRMTVTEDGHDPIEIGPGDVALFPRGWSGTWEIHETIRKIYAIF